ncbi:MAG: DMT family transporter [Candidatus Aminicenantes bacterium]|nr:DMT family transporter [Candidatus Aminicenantes bacterium]MDH5383872.1 DMT family transporter [Candidatus Aminicenantes bacterium]MDH5742342.1 DMT family transporter [Candidatus Aminicenantes bacterium]
MEDQVKFGLTDIYMLMAVFFWAINFPFIKIALGEFSPFAFNGIRLTFASVVLVWSLFLSKQGFGVEKRDIWKLVVLGIIGNTIYQVFFIQGINLTTASSTAIIMAMTPASVALLSSLLKHEKIHWVAWLGIALSFIGFYLVITGQPGTFIFSWKNLKGDLMIFSGNIVWAVYTVFSKPLLGRISPLKWSSLTLVAGTVFYLPFCIPAFIRQDFGQVTFKAWSILIYSGLFALAFSYVAWYASVKKIGNSKTAIYGNMTPIMTVIFAYVFIAEKISLWQAIGAIIILFGVYLTRSGDRLFRKNLKLV